MGVYYDMFNSLCKICGNRKQWDVSDLKVIIPVSQLGTVAKENTLTFYIKPEISDYLKLNSGKYEICTAISVDDSDHIWISGDSCHIITEKELYKRMRSGSICFQDGKVLNQLTKLQVLKDDFRPLELLINKLYGLDWDSYVIHWNLYPEDWSGEGQIIVIINDCVYFNFLLFKYMKVTTTITVKSRTNARLDHISMDETIEKITKNFNTLSKLLNYNGQEIN